MRKTLIFILLLTAVAAGQKPVPALPRMYIDTTWNPPSGGVTWHARISADLQNALNSAHPGDTIVLDAGSIYTGNFTLPAKANPLGQWIYIQSSALSRLPAPGVRIGPSNAPNMAKIVTPNATAALNPLPGANHYRLVGLEVTTASNQGCNPSTVPPTNCFTYFLFAQTNGGLEHPTQLPDSITFDRVYMHGSNTYDVREGIQGNVTNLAVIDSYISDIHQGYADSQAIIAYFTPGPIKIVDNFLSATTENVMFGGAANHSFHFDTSAVASNVAVAVPNHASNTVQGMADPSDTEAVNYIGTDGAQHRISTSAVVSSIQPQNDGVNYGSPLTGAITMNFANCTVSATFTITCSSTGANTTLSNLGTVALNTSLLPGVAAANNLGTAPLPFGDGYFGGAANHSFHFDTSAVASNVAIAVPNANSNTVQGIANPSDAEAVNYIDTSGVQHRISVPQGTVTGTGTSTYLPYWTGTSSLGATADFTYTSGTHTLAGSASAIFDFSSASSFKPPGTGGTLTLGTANQNWGTLGTGVVINTTTTGAQTVIAASGAKCYPFQESGGTGCDTPSGGDTITSPNLTLSIGGSSTNTTLDVVGAAGKIMAGATPP